jgi:hypothetical protein
MSEKEKAVGNAIGCWLVPLVCLALLSDICIRCCCSCSCCQYQPPGKEEEAKDQEEEDTT